MVGHRNRFQLYGWPSMLIGTAWAVFTPIMNVIIELGTEDFLTIGWFIQTNAIHICCA